MDFTEIIKAMETMTDAQITSIQESAYGIIKSRDGERKAKAIQNFKEAFCALRETGVYVSVTCECEDYCIDEYIDDVDRFDFSY